jgi:hypothetical protein
MPIDVSPGPHCSSEVRALVLLSHGLRPIVQRNVALGSVSGSSILDEAQRSVLSAAAAAVAESVATYGIEDGERGDVVPLEAATRAVVAVFEAAAARRAAAVTDTSGGLNDIPIDPAISTFVQIATTRWPEAWARHFAPRIARDAPLCAAVVCARTADVAAVVGAVRQLSAASTTTSVAAAAAAAATVVRCILHGVGGEGEGGWCGQLVGGIPAAREVARHLCFASGGLTPSALLSACIRTVLFEAAVEAAVVASPQSVPPTPLAVFGAVFSQVTALLASVPASEGGATGGIGAGRKLSLTARRRVYTTPYAAVAVGGETVASVLSSASASPSSSAAAQPLTTATTSCLREWSELHRIVGAALGPGASVDAAALAHAALFCDAKGQLPGSSLTDAAAAWDTIASNAVCRRLLGAPLALSDFVTAATSGAAWQLQSALHCCEPRTVVSDAAVPSVRFRLPSEFIAAACPVAARLPPETLYALLAPVSIAALSAHAFAAAATVARATTNIYAREGATVSPATPALIAAAMQSPSDALPLGFDDGAVASPPADANVADAAFAAAAALTWMLRVVCDAVSGHGVAVDISSVDAAALVAWAAAPIAAPVGFASGGTVTASNAGCFSALPDVCGLEMEALKAAWIATQLMAGAARTGSAADGTTVPALEASVARWWATASALRAPPSARSPVALLSSIMLESVAELSARS